MIGIKISVIIVKKIKYQKNTLCLEKTIKFLEDIEPFSTEKNKHFIDICKGGIDAIAEDYTVYNNERRDTK